MEIQRELTQEEYEQIIKANQERMAKDLENWFNKEEINDEEICDILITYAGGHKKWELFCKLVERANLTKKAFNVGLKEAWISGLGSKDFLAYMYFEESDPQLIMNEEELTYYDSLPPTVTLYRGCSKDEVEGKTFGFSWTTDRKVAEFFAFRHEQEDTAVYSIEVPKRFISAIFLERREFEAIYLYANEEDDLSVNLVTEVPTEYYDNFIKEQEEEKEQYLREVEGSV